MNLMLLGAIAMGLMVAGLFFLRFWRDTRDRFFLFFAIAFFILGANRIAQGLNPLSTEQEPYFYLVRFFAYLLILIAIVDKNRKPGTKVKDAQK